MEVFINVIVYIVVMILINNIYKNKILNRFSSLIITIYLIIVSGFRDVSIGIDTSSYYSYFMRNLSWNEIADYYDYQGLLFWYFMKGIYDIFYEYQIVLILCAIISVSLISRYIHKYSKYPMLSYLIYVTCGFYALGLSQIRQYLAISILVYSFDYIREKNICKFIIVFFIAFLIHPSSILFLPAYFLSNLKVNIKTISIYLGILLSSIIGAKFIIIIITNIFFYGSGYDELFIAVGEQDNGRVAFIIYTLLLLLVLIKRRTILSFNNRNIIFYNFLWLAVIIQSISFIFPVASRAAYFYSIYLIVFVPNIIATIKNVYIRIYSIIFLIILSLFVYFYKFYNLNDIYPYKFFN